MFENPMVAIDIGSTSVKVVELAGKQQRKLSRMGNVPLPPGSIVNGSIRDFRAVERALHASLRATGTRRFLKRAALSLGGSSVIVKRVRITEQVADIEDQVLSEAEKHFQMDINDLYFDFQSFSQGLTSSEQVVLLVGAKKEIVDDRVMILKSAGLKIGLMDCDVFALTNMVEHNYGILPGLIAIVNVGTTASQVIFLGNGQYLYNREVGLGGEHFTKAIADSLNCSYEEAELAKLRDQRGEIALNPDVQKAVSGVNEQLVSELQMTIDFFFQSGEAPIDQDRVKGVFLSGGAALSRKLAESIASKLSVHVEIADPFKNILVPGRLSRSHLRFSGAAFGTVVGLGLRRFEDRKE